MNENSRGFRRTYLPYCIYPVTDHKAFWQIEWVVLNRQYKPLGGLGDEWYDYKKIPMRVTGLDKETLKRISHCGGKKPITMGAPVFLYDDGCVPDQSAHRKAYMGRLIALDSALVIRARDNNSGFFAWVALKRAGDNPRGDFIRDTRALLRAGRGEEDCEKELLHACAAVYDKAKKLWREYRKSCGEEIMNNKNHLVLFQD